VTRWAVKVDAFVRAAEAIEDGDRTLASDLFHTAFHDHERTYPCAACGLSFAWPGLRDAHNCAAAGRELG
jgi:hypothetical protein